ncbi:hypothetical protein L7P61_21620, partial [Aeromonas veronii bv. sobria]|uniref:hypothetical protein n=1 Tax=Aeromonas veronii TaxID=654 RepID=UPI003CE5B74B
LVSSALALRDTKQENKATAMLLLVFISLYPIYLKHHRNIIAPYSQEIYPPNTATSHQQSCH